jgi:RHS repeat-associated protein
MVLVWAAVLIWAVVLTGVPASPARAAGDDPAAPVVGGFALGNGLEGRLDEHDGSFGFTVAAGPVNLSWDSRAIGADRHRIGPGWTLGFGRVETKGGVRVITSTGEAFPVNRSWASGLDGYRLADIRFTAEPGVLPARADGAAAEVSYSYTLAELGGTTTYFSASGDPVARIGPFEERTDWRWNEGDDHRPSRIVDSRGLVTELTWRRDRVTITTGLGVTARGHAPATWEIRLDAAGRIASIVDAVGRHTRVTVDRRGLVSRLESSSGARTTLEWTPRSDGTASVATAKTLDSAGEELASREWRPIAGGPASGWPLVGDGGAGRPVGRSSTMLSDGHTVVESDYNELGLLVERRVSVDTASGHVEQQRHRYAYPSTDARGRPTTDREALPATWSRPTSATVRFRDARGASREARQSAEFDDLGRPRSVTAPDGSSVETEYDATPGPRGALPVGLPTLERRVSADRQVVERRSKVNAAGTAVVETEERSGPEGGELTRTGLTEFTVDETTGELVEERVFPDGDIDAAPVVTLRAQVVDPAAGTLKMTETRAAGTAAEATSTSTVSLVHGAVLTETSPAGTVIEAEYDAAGRPTALVDAVGRRTETSYELAERDGRNATTVTRPDGASRTDVTDAVGRLTRVIDNVHDGVAEPGYEHVVETRDHDGHGTVRITDAWGAVTTTRQDAFGRVVEAIAPTGAKQLKRYDDVANTTTTAVTAGGFADAVVTRTETRDARGAVTEQRTDRADGAPSSIVRTSYDGLGRTLRVADARQAVGISYDRFGNPTTTTVAGLDTDDAAVVAERRFDALGTSLEKTMTSGEERREGRRRETDELGRTVDETDRAGRHATSRYSADGLVTEHTTGSGAVTVNTYDPRTRLLVSSETTTTDGRVARTGYAYHPATDRLVAVFDPADRPGTEVTTAYDAYGNVTSVTYPDGGRIRHEYDPHGRKIRTIDVGGNITDYGYDVAGLLTSAVQTDAAGEELARVSSTHDELGRVTRLDRGNGSSTEYSYTSLSQIERELTTHADGSIERDYAYDPRGNLVSRRETRRDGVAESVTSTTYTYDARDRLTSSVVDTDAADGDGRGPVRVRTDYTLTLGGDIATETVTRRAGTPAEEVRTREFGYRATGELVSVTTVAPDGSRSVAEQTYDEAGNLTRAVDGTTYRYDAADRPVAETDPTGATVETSYWADGSRAALTHGGASTTYYWDGDVLLNDAHATEPAQKPTTVAYLLGTGRHARTAGETVYTVEDRHRNVTELTDRDGRLSQQYAYADYGTTSGGRADRSIGDATAAGVDAEAETDEPAVRVGDPEYQPFGYAGEYHDPTPADTQHLGDRSYAMGVARFTAPDVADVDNPYSFADANPITLVDPTGRTPQDDILPSVAIGLGVVLAVFSIAAAAFTGGTTLGAFGAVVTGTGIVGDAYSIAVGVGRLLALHQPDWVAQGAQEFFNSDAAMYSELAIGLVVGAMTYLGVKVARTVRNMKADGVWGWSKADRAEAAGLVRNIEETVRGQGALLRRQLDAFPEVTSLDAVEMANVRSGSTLSRELSDTADRLRKMPPSGRWSIRKHAVGDLYPDLRAQLNEASKLATERNLGAVAARFGELRDQIDESWDLIDRFDAQLFALRSRVESGAAGATQVPVARAAAGGGADGAFAPTIPHWLEEGY